MDTCLCMTESLHCSPETITTLLIGYTPITNVFCIKNEWKLIFFLVFLFCRDINREYESIRTLTRNWLDSIHHAGVRDVSTVTKTTNSLQLQNRSFWPLSREVKGLHLTECLENYGWRFMTLYRRWGSRPSPWKRKAKRLSKEALQIAVKRREEQSKGDKDRYSHLNAEFQRTARRDKKVIQ